MRFIYTRAFAIFASCIVIAALLAIMQIKGWLWPIAEVFVELPRPVVAAARGVTRPVRHFFSTIYQLKKISNDNSRLQQQVTALQQSNVQLDEYKRENEILKTELGFINAAKQEYQPCSVISHNPLGLLDTLLLNCGSNQGLAEGQAVVSQGYLVGKVVYATPHSSTVLLITNSKFSADVKLSKSGALGIVGGSFGTGLIMDRLSQNDAVEKGALVVTAGISDKIPKDILIGEVGDVISTPNDLFKRVTLISPINFSDISFVWVAK